MNLLNIRKDEKAVVLLLLMYSFTIGIGMYIYYTAATTLFLSKFESDMLPFAYIAGGFFVFLIGKVSSAIQKHINFTALTSGLIVLLAVSMAILLIGYRITNYSWLVFLIYLWIRANLFVFSFTFWLSASRLFNLGQAKRLYSLIGTGEVLASITANFLVKTLISAKLATVESLLYVALGFIVLSLLIFTKIIRKYTQKLLYKKAENEAVTTSGPSAGKNYLMLMYLLGLIPIACLYIIEFSFSVDSKRYFPDKEQLAIFLSQFLFICSLIELLVKGILFRFVTKTYGIMSGLLVIPVSLIIICCLVFIMTAFDIKVFFLLLISRFLITSVRRAFSDTSFQLLYQPIPRSESIVVQSQVETYAKPLGYAVAGVVLIFLAHAGFSSTVSVFLFLLFFLIIWAILAFMMQKEYRQILLNILVSIKPVKNNIISRVLYDRSMAVADTSQKLSFDELIKLTESSLTSDRVKSAYLLGESGRYHAYKYLIKLFSDSDIRVQLAAIEASSKLNRPEVIPYLLAEISAKDLQASIKKTLIEIGPSAINYFHPYFNKYEEKNEVLYILIDIAEAIGSSKAITFLRSKLKESPDEVAIHIMKALIKLQYKPNQGEESYALLQIDLTINAYLWLLAAENDLINAPINTNLITELRNERKKVMLKILTILSFLRADNQFEKIEELIYGVHPQTKSYLADLVGLLIDSREVSARVLTLFEDISDYEILLNYENRYPQQNLSTEQRLLTIINKDNLNAWTKALALKELLHYHDENTIKILAANVKTDNILLAEAALYGLAKSSPERFNDISAYFQAKNDQKYINLCRKVKAFKSENDLTISNLENTVLTNNAVT